MSCTFPDGCPPAWPTARSQAEAGAELYRAFGDPWTLPLAVAVVDQAIVWEHRGTFAGDHPRLDAMPRLVTT